MVKRPPTTALVGMLIAAWLVATCTAVPASPAAYPEAVRSLAIETLAQQLDVTTDSIELISADEMMWNDAGLGCPEAGKAYAQMIVSGYKVVLRMDGQTYDVHTGEGKAVVCGPGGRPMTREQEDVPSTVPDPQTEKAEAIARQSLAEVVGVAVDQIEVLSAESVQWNDASLGCPEAGKVYAQALVAGYRVMLRVAGEIYEAHTGGNHAVICGPEGRPMRTETGTAESAARVVISKAKAHLAERLALDVAEIELVKVEPREWRSSGLGCEQPGMNYLQVIVPGQLILLRASDQVYEYHAGEGRVVPCQRANGVTG